MSNQKRDNVIIDAPEKRAWLDLVEKSDRTSPDDYPTMALITEEELGGIIREAVASLRAQLDAAEADAAMWKTGCELAVDKRDEAIADRDAAQAEARGLRDNFAALRRTIDNRLNIYLCDMRPNHDDSITGFNEAWEIVTNAFEAAKDES